MKLENVNVFITGANRGIGRDLLRECLSRGAGRVYAGVRDLSTLETSDSRVEPILLDVTQPASVREAAALAGDCQLLINNAGILEFGTAIEATETNFEKAFAVNFYGVLRMAQAFTPVLQVNHGAMVNVLTLLSLASMPGMAAYNASKAAVWSLTLSLRATLAADNIAVHSVFPGAVDTDMLAGVDMPKTAPKDVASAILAGVAADVEDIFPDPMSQQVYEAWRQDHKVVEAQFAGM